MRSLKQVAVIFYPSFQYSRELTDGIVDFLEEHQSFHPHFVANTEGEGTCPISGSFDAIDGAITWSTRSDIWIEWLVARGIPVINCGSDWLGHPSVVCVQPEGDGDPTACLDHFATIGLSRSNFLILSSADRPGIDLHVKNFLKEAEQRQFESSWFELPSEYFDTSQFGVIELEKVAEMVEWIRALPKPCGIYCEDDDVAELCCRAVLSLGLSIPRDVAVVGKGDTYASRLNVPRISTVTRFAVEAGYESARIMDERLRGITTSDGRFCPKPNRVITRESTVGKHGDPVAERVHRMIQRYACEGITVNELVPKSGVSRKTLIRRFSDAFDCDPSEEIRRVRADRARDLLSKSQLSVSDIAIKCGFSSQTSFTNFFVRQEGNSPREYRNKHREY